MEGHKLAALRDVLERAVLGMTNSPHNQVKDITFSGTPQGLQRAGKAGYHKHHRSNMQQGGKARPEVAQRLEQHPENKEQQMEVLLCPATLGKRDAGAGGGGRGVLPAWQCSNTYNIIMHVTVRAYVDSNGMLLLESIYNI